jgi:hypothetical protein
MNEQPEFEHDCDACVSLGRYWYHLVSYDLYVCEQPGLPKTFVARSGKDGEKYLSLPAWALEINLPCSWGTLLEAKRRFEQQKDEKCDET